MATGFSLRHTIRPDQQELQPDVWTEPIASADRAEEHARIMEELPCGIDE